MRVFKENYNNINILTIRDIDIDNDSIAEELKYIIKSLRRVMNIILSFLKKITSLRMKRFKGIELKCLNLLSKMDYTH